MTGRQRLVLLHTAKWLSYAVAAVMIGYLIFAIVYAAQGGT